MNAVAIDQVAMEFAAGPFRARMRVLAGVTLALEAGTVTGLLGPNGSGKSTLLKIVAGLLTPTAGTCRLFGRPSMTIEARTAIGYLPEAPGFDRWLSGFEWVRYHATLSGIPRARAGQRAEAALEGVGLGAAMHRRAGSYSLGMRQRLGLAQALVHEPPLVILDEPMGGLDPVATAETGRLIRRLRDEGRTVFFSSHQLGQVAELCDRVAILNRGRIVLEGSVEDLTRGRGAESLLVDAMPAALLQELRGWLGARGVKVLGVEAPRIGLEPVFLAAVHRAEEQIPVGS